jgi:hypothetical protein
LAEFDELSVHGAILRRFDQAEAVYYFERLKAPPDVLRVSDAALFFRVPGLLRRDRRANLGMSCGSGMFFDFELGLFVRYWGEPSTRLSQLFGFQW